MDTRTDKCPGCGRKAGWDMGEQFDLFGNRERVVICVRCGYVQAVATR